MSTYCVMRLVLEIISFRCWVFKLRILRIRSVWSRLVIKRSLVLKIKRNSLGRYSCRLIERCRLRLKRYKRDIRKYIRVICKIIWIICNIKIIVYKCRIYRIFRYKIYLCRVCSINLRIIYGMDIINLDK